VVERGRPAMRLAFCGTPEFAVPTLQRLLAEPDFRIEAVLTQPDRPKGRGLEAVASPVKATALAAGIPVVQPEKVRAPEAAGWLEKLAPDAVVILAYGQIIPANLLVIPRLGWINLHASLLPKYRGAAPIAWAVANGESRTGLTTMQIDAGMDTGPILLQQEMEILRDETAPALSARMAEAGAPLVVATLRGLENGTIAPRPQYHSQATYAPLLKREDGRIDWTLGAEQIYNRIRAFAPWPGASTSFRGQRCQIGGRPAPPEALFSGAQSIPPGTIVTRGAALDVACGGVTWLRIETVQLEGRKRISAREFLSGARLALGERFGA
jgi:methionyl-tRNA formyltransferase